MVTDLWWDRDSVAEYLTPEDECLAKIRIKKKFFFQHNADLRPTPAEEKDDVIKYVFYDVEILFGDFSARVGKVGILGTSTNFHDQTLIKGLRLLYFAWARDMGVCRSRYQYKKIYQATCLSPDRKTHNYIVYR